MSNHPVGEDRPVLVLNAGSSTLKYQVVRPGAGEVLHRGAVERVEERGFPAALGAMHDDLAGAGVTAADLRAVGHRVVHGGADLTRPVLVDDDVLARIDELGLLDPLHNPPAAAGLRSAAAAYPGLPQAAVFDTAFFADLPDAAAAYAIDRGVARDHGVRRYGAHGTSHQYVAEQAAGFLGRPGAAVITLHLGSGASAAAVRDGRPLDTSMGLTPLEGLVMGTRGGDLDPGVLLHLLRHAGLDADGLDDLLHHRCGLKGLAGHSDHRDLMAALERGDEAARTAHAVYCHRLRKYVGAYLAVLGRTDAVVFTAGVGEHQPRVRADALAGLEPLGVAVDPARNEAAATGARRISPDGSPVAVLVVPTDEELAIARQVAALLP